MQLSKPPLRLINSASKAFLFSTRISKRLSLFTLLLPLLLINIAKAQITPTSHQDRFGTYHWTGDYRGLKAGSNDPLNFGASLAGSLGTHTIRIPVGPNFNNINTCDTVWFDDSPPAGSSLGSDGDNWNNSENSNLAPLFPFSGSVAFKSSSVAGMHQLFFLTSVEETLKINSGDMLFAYIYITSTNSQNSEVMLQWHEQNGTFDHRAYWGANQLSWGGDGTFSRRNAGSLPEIGKWVRLEIPASSVGLEGKIIDGLAFSLYDCQAIWDRSGVSKNQAIWLEDVSIPATGINAINDSPSAQLHPFSGNVAYQTANDSSLKNLPFGIPAASINGGDYLVSWVYLNPNNPPQEIMLQWFVEGAGQDAWEHRAYWGPNLIQYWGINESDSRRNIGLLPVTGKWVRLEVPASLVGLEGKKVTNVAVTIDKGQIAWDRVGKSLNETVWIDDTASQGTLTNSNPTPFSGEAAFKSTLEPAMHQFAIDKAAEPLKINNGDILFAYVYLDPDTAKTPSEVMIQWKEPNNSWEHRAYWGPDLIQFWGFNGTASRKNLGPLPDSGKWVRLEIPASSVGLEGKTIDAVAFTLYGGQATIDRVGKINSLASVVTNPVYDKLFRNPQFNTYLLTTYSSGAGNNNWLDGLTNEEKQVEREEIKQLGKYLLYPGRYPNKLLMIIIRRYG
jgi:hypothetical protein